MPISAESQKKQEFQKTSALLTTPKPLTLWITTDCGKFLKRWEYQTTLPTSREICTQFKKQQLELNTEQQTGSKLGKEYIKAVYCHPAYLTYMWNTSCEMLGWMTHKIARRNINNLRYVEDTTVMVERKEKLRSFLMKLKEESEKAGLKLNFQKPRSHHPVPSLHGK